MSQVAINKIDAIVIIVVSFVNLHDLPYITSVTNIVTCTYYFVIDCQSGIRTKKLGQKANSIAFCPNFLYRHTFAIPFLWDIFSPINRSEVMMVFMFV